MPYSGSASRRPLSRAIRWEKPTSEPAPVRATSGSPTTRRGQRARRVGEADPGPADGSERQADAGVGDARLEEVVARSHDDCDMTAVVARHDAVLDRVLDERRECERRERAVRDGVVDGDRP